MNKQKSEGHGKHDHSKKTHQQSAKPANSNRPARQAEPQPSQWKSKPQRPGERSGDMGVNDGE